MFKILLSLLIIFPVLMGFGEIFQKLFGGFGQVFLQSFFEGCFTSNNLASLSFFVPLNIWIESISILNWGLVISLL